MCISTTSTLDAPPARSLRAPPYLPCSQEPAAPPLGAPDETPGFSWQPPHTPPSHEQTLSALLPTHPGPRHSHPCPHPAALGTGHSLLAGLALMPPIVYLPWGAKGSLELRARPSHPLRSPPCPPSSLPVGARVPKMPAGPGHCPPSPASFSPTHLFCPQDRGSLGRVPKAFGFCSEAAPWTHPTPWAPAFTVTAWTWHTDMFMASQPHQVAAPQAQGRAAPSAGALVRGPALSFRPAPSYGSNTGPHTRSWFLFQIMKQTFSPDNTTSGHK